MAKKVKKEANIPKKGGNAYYIRLCVGWKNACILTLLQIFKGSLMIVPILYLTPRKIKNTHTFFG